jgi:hypothetical protein
MADLFEHPTIAQLVESISAAAVRDEGPGLPGRSELAALDDASRLAWLTGYLEERLEPAAAADAGEEGSARAGFDAAAATTRLVWDLRRDLDLSVYPHELRHARSVGELAEIVSGILAGRAPEPPPVTRAEGVAPAAALSGSTPAPAPDDDPLTDPIVFLLSAPRSGSTLLRLMLAGHPSLFCPPELALLSAGGMREWHGQQHGIFARDGITHALMELRGVDEREARAELAELVAADRPVKEVFRRLQRDAGARVLLDKSPAYLLDPAALARAEALFDGARYLLLTRHPVAVIESLVRHRMEALLAPGPIDDPWSFAEQVWVRANRNLLDLEAAHGDRCLRVRYEHLVRDPEGVSRRIAEFLDLPFDPGLLHPYAGGRMIDGPGDPDIFQHDGIDASLAEAWRSVELPRALEARTLEVAEALGYVGGELAGAGNGPSPGAGAGQAVPRDPRDATLLLDRLNDLSDDEVEATLSALLGEEADG